MPKIRGIKPELWTDESFVELSAYARLLWIGLWNHACDNGHLQDKSKQIKMRILPTDNVNAADLLRELETQRLIVRVGGWITIPNLSDHQKPHKHWYVICDKPGCIHPPGMTYGIGKTACTKTDCRHGSTVDQPLTNQSAPVDQPVSNGGSTADVEVDGDVDGELMVKVIKNPSSDKSDAMDRFPEFWDAYAKKTNRKAAEAKWRLALKRKDVTPDLLIEAAHAYVTWERANNEGGRYVMDPAKWLNGHRWEDERPARRLRPAEQHQGRASQWLQLAADLGEPTPPANIREIGPAR